MASTGRSWRGALLAGVCGGMLCCGLLVAGCDRPLAGEQKAAQAPACETTRMSFQELFDVNGAMVTPKKIIKVGSTVMTPDVPFESSVMRIDDAPFTDFIGRDAEVKKEQDLYRIIRFF